MIDAVSPPVAHEVTHDPGTPASRCHTWTVPVDFLRQLSLGDLGRALHRLSAGGAPDDANIVVLADRVSAWKRVPE